MNASTIGPAVILVLATIGAARVIRLAYLASRASLRALGRGMASIGSRLGRLGTQAPGLTQADVDRAVADALAKQAPKTRAKRDAEPPEVTGN